MKDPDAAADRGGAKTDKDAGYSDADMQAAHGRFKAKHKEMGTQEHPHITGNPPAKRGNWIAGAIKHPGALHRELGVPQEQKIPAGKLSAAASQGGKIGRQARLAQTLKRMH